METPQNFDQTKVLVSFLRYSPLYYGKYAGRATYQDGTVSDVDFSAPDVQRYIRRGRMSEDVRTLLRNIFPAPEPINLGFDPDPPLAPR